jgi:hypothetical protein
VGFFFSACCIGMAEELSLDSQPIQLHWTAWRYAQGLALVDERNQTKE